MVEGVLNSRAVPAVTSSASPVVYPVRGAKSWNAWPLGAPPSGAQPAFAWGSVCGGPDARLFASMLVFKKVPHIRKAHMCFRACAFAYFFN
ncbi:unnamed protein product [Gongylonema pulchrum]|uniref:Uncharacterized protein n=1 Tax=Gongylonema pulchrum TaxID=637853 RepID=A0A183DWR9_9BILA|nr:unnamed protein product [Gongylonema pulchrum]